MTGRISTTRKLSMKTNFARCLAASATVALSAVSLSACGAGISDTPADVMKNYINHLNAGEYDEALSLVASPGDIESENVLNIGETSISEPLLGDEDEISEDAEAVSLFFKVGAEGEGDVDFVRVDGKWKLENPLFLVPLWPGEDDVPDGGMGPQIVEDTNEAKQSLELTSPDGKPVTNESVTVAMFGQVTEVAAKFPGSDLFKPAEGTLTFEFDSSDQFGITDPDHPDSEFEEPVFTDTLNVEAVKAAVDRAEKTYNEDYGTYSISNIELTETALAECGGSLPHRPWSTDLFKLGCNVSSATFNFETDWNPEQFTSSETFDAGQSVVMTPDLDRFNHEINLGITFKGGEMTGADVSVTPESFSESAAP